MNKKEQENKTFLRYLFFCLQALCTRMMQLLAIKYNIQEFRVNIRLLLNLARYPGCFKKQPGIRMAPRFTKSNNPPLLKTPLPSNEYERNKPPGA